MKKLRPLAEDAKFSEFASVRMKLSWLGNTRPDLCLEISQLAQVTHEAFKEERKTHVKRVNRVIKMAQENKYGLNIASLDKESLEVIGFSDASFAANADMSSQLGYICLLGDRKSDNVIPIFYKSYKARRVTRSVMTAETIAFSDLFDCAFTLATELKRMLPGVRIPVKLFTDNKSLFDVISKGTRTSEKRLMLDIAAAREGFSTRAISDIGLVRSDLNLADGLTKTMNQAMLLKVMKLGKLSRRAEQWIIRT